MASNEIQDLGYEGFTWWNNRDEGPIQHRLSCGLASKGWSELYLETHVLHRALEGLDHVMLVLSTDGTLRNRR